MRSFVIFDRDGTIIKDCHYLSDPRQVELLPGVADGLRQLQAMSLGLVIVTNQSGIGRGLFGRAQLDLVHDRLNQVLGDEGVVLDGIYFCPHSPGVGCECRKPQVGLVHSAARDHDFQPRDSFVIGDRSCDMELGSAIEARTFLVNPSKRTHAELATMPDYVVADVAGAVPIIARLIAETRSRQYGAPKPTEAGDRSDRSRKRALYQDDPDTGVR